MPIFELNKEYYATQYTMLKKIPITHHHMPNVNYACFLLHMLKIFWKGLNIP